MLDDDHYTPPVVPETEAQKYNRELGALFQARSIIKGGDNLRAVEAKILEFLDIPVPEHK